MFSSILPVLLILSFLSPIQALAQNAPAISSIVGGLLVRNPSSEPGQTSALYFLSGQGGPESGGGSGQIRSRVVNKDPLTSTVEIRSQGASGPSTGIKILPNGSIVMGGLSNNEIRGGGGPASVIPPADLPKDFETLGQGHLNSGIYDFLLAMPQPNDPDARSALRVRNIAIHDTQDPPNLDFMRSRHSMDSNQRALYGQLLPMIDPGNSNNDTNGYDSSLGGITWRTFTKDGISAPNAFISGHVRSNLATQSYAPGAIKFGVGGGTPSSPTFKIGMILNEQGRLSVGDIQKSPEAALHVFGDAKVEGDLTVMGKIISTGGGGGVPAPSSDITANNLTVNGDSVLKGNLTLSANKIIQAGAINLDSDATVGRNLRVKGVAQFLSGIETTGCSGCTAVSSDQRLKENITPLNNLSDKVLGLSPVSFKYKDSLGLTLPGGLQYGLIAQDVEKLFPDMVGTDQNGYKTVDYQKLTPLLLETVKEQDRKISDLRSDIDKLKKEIDQLAKYVQLNKQP